MTKTIQSLRGTKDIFGDEARVWESLEAAARSVFERFGFDPVRTPLIEETQLFKSSVGEVTDIVQKEMYHFLDRSETDIALRPEGTASVARAFIENHMAQEKPVTKLYYYGPMFRAERPQAGRMRQFHQIGAETFGSASSFADAESIESLVRILDYVGVKGFSIELNNLGDAETRARYSEILRQYLKGSESKLCDDCRTRIQKNVFRVLDCKVRECQPVIEGAPKISDHASEESKKAFEEVRELLKGAGIETQHNPRIVRGLDYYTHTVFELRHPALGSQDALAAGGRYDTLVEKLGGQKTPAVGYAIGIERLLMAVANDNPGFTKPLRANNWISIIHIGQAAKKSAWSLLSELRREGLVVHMELDDRSVKAQMRAADKHKSRFAIIIGDTELEKGVVVFKDMSAPDSEAEVRREDILLSIKGYKESDLA